MNFMDIKVIYIIAQKELRDSFKNRWLLLFSISFGGLALALAWLTLSGTGSFGTVSFSRTSASLINLIILIVPLMGLTLGAVSISSELEKGNLHYLLSHPINRLEIICGKFIGLSFALLGSLTIGFGLSGLFISYKGGIPQIDLYFSFIGLTFLLSLVSLSLGILISTSTRKTVSSLGITLFLWLLLVFFTDLGLMGTAIVLKLQISELFYISIINPLQVFKVSSILILNGNLDVLGPGGTYAIQSYGKGLLPILLGILFLYTIFPIFLAYFVLQRRGDL